MASSRPRQVGLPSREALRRDLAEFMAGPFLEHTRTLVNISSQSGDPDGLERSAEAVQGVARAMLGDEVPIQIERLTDPEDKITRPFLVIGASEPDTVLVAHHDMVKAATEEYRFGTSGTFDPATGLYDYYTGPGVHDDKGQIVIGLKAMQLMAKHNPEVFSRCALYVGADEEIGSRQGRFILARLAKTATLALGLEGAEVDFGAEGDDFYGIKVGRKGYAKYRVTFKGVESHAGYAPTNRPDANQASTYFNARIYNWLERHQSVSGNPGVPPENPGNQTNQISGFVEVEWEARSFHKSELEAFESFLYQLPNRDRSGVKIEMAGGLLHDPWAVDQNSLRALTNVRRVAKEFQLGPIRGVQVPGGSDINSTRTRARLDAFGGIGSGDHGVNEWLSGPSVPKAILLTFGTAVALTGEELKLAKMVSSNAGVVREF